MNEVGVDSSWECQDIKRHNIDEATLDAIKDQYGSYEAIFSKRAMKYKSMGLKDKKLNDRDYKKLMLEEYTFLQRPIFFVNGKYFVGNAAKTVNAVKEALKKA